MELAGLAQAMTKVEAEFRIEGRKSIVNQVSVEGSRNRDNDLKKTKSNLAHRGNSARRKFKNAEQPKPVMSKSTSPLLPRIDQSETDKRLEKHKESSQVQV